MGHSSRDRAGDSRKEGKEEERHRSGDKGKDRKDKKSSNSSSHSRHKSHSKSKSKSRVVDDDGDNDEEDLWVEKGAGDGMAEEPNSVANIPTRDSLHLTSHAPPSSSGPALPVSVTAETLPKEKREDWMLSDTTVTRTAPPVRQSDNSIRGGTFSVGEMPTGIARPSMYNTLEQFTDGYGEGEVGTKGSFGGAVHSSRERDDFFSSLGTERRKKETEVKPKVQEVRMSSREINAAAYNADGTRAENSVAAIAGEPTRHSNTADGQRPPIPGSSGSGWRMSKLKRVYEVASEEGRDPEEVGIERFGSVELWEAAKDEKKVMDNRGNRRGNNAGLAYGRDRGDERGSAGNKTGRDDGLDEFGRERRSDAGGSSSGGPAGPSGSGQSSTPSHPNTRYIFNEQPNSAASSRPPSRAGSFRRPGSSSADNSRSGTPVPVSRTPSGVGNTPKASTPIPSVFTPPPMGAALANAARKPSQLQVSTTATEETVATSQGSEGLLSQAPMSPTSLNRLQAKILRAKLMGGDAARLKEMEETYERETARAKQGDRGGGYFDAKDVGQHADPGARQDEIRVLPTLDGRGRLYDVGRSGEAAEDADDAKLGPGNGKRKRKEKYFETRDPKTGELLRYNADDDTTSLEELVRQERFGAGSGDSKNMDIEMASRIAGDAKFEDDLDYMDDSAERLARKKQKTEAQKKLFAINDYGKTKKALDTCQFCYQDTETTTVPPQAAVVAMGTRAYLALPLFEPLVEGHALIVPMQHHLSTLEADDDTWDEMRNFMKTLMQMHAQQDKGVVFYETVLSFKGQRHTYIECIPLPWATFEEMPGYFREAILTVEAEWSQHKKLIDFSARPGGFRRALVPNLPYFMVHWDHKGEKGYGHVIEGPETETGAGDGYDFDEGAKGGGEFKRNFAAEIIGEVMELQPRLWRKPRRMDRKLNDERIKHFRRAYDAHDWTKMLSQTSDQ